MLYRPGIMARQQTSADLVQMIRMALHTADELCEPGAAAHINQALVVLVGKGEEPKGVDAASPLDRRETES